MNQQPPFEDQIQWRGHYWQDGQKHTMHFKHMMMDVHGNLSGHGHDDAGEFHINGNMSNNWLNCNKQYSTYCVNYRGQCLDHSGWFRGNWQIPGDCGGNFELRCDLPHWTGSYWQGSQRNDMAQDLSVTQKGVYGQGWDSEGFFVIRGECSGHDVYFRKQYVGKHHVDYYGKYHNHGRAKVEGHWELDGEQNAFELHQY